MDKQIEDLYKVYQQCSQVCIDSRKVEEGSIFFALKGPNFDGNKFAKDALDQGAAFVVIDDSKQQIEGQSLLVDNVLISLQKLSKHHRSQLSIPIIGITGSNGKTTSKELVKKVLETKYSVSATEGNYNNTIGVPLSLLNIGVKHEVGIIEMGSNGKGEIEFLCKLAQPSIGLITSIGKAHLEGFGDINGVIEEKTALYRSVGDTNGVIIYNDDSIYLKQHIKDETHNIPYSKKGCFAFELDIDATFPKIRARCKRGSTVLDLQSNLYGEYNVSNIISALVIGELLDINLEDGVDAINKYKPTNNRSEIKDYNGASIYLDAYNANPTSVTLVLKEFSRLPGKKILILGDMLEIGKGEDAEHHTILSSIETTRFDRVILFGELFGKHKQHYKSFAFFSDIAELKNYFNTLDLTGKHVLLKGSRSMGLERLIT